MIILSDCLTEKIDEGCLKIASSLTKRIKAQNPDTTIISYGRDPRQSNIHLQLNNLFFNRSLLALIWRKRESVLYMPFASNTKASALRTWVLSRVARNGLRVIFALRFPMDGITKKLLKISGAEIIALSRDSYEFYRNEIGGKAIYLKTGINTKQFVPADAERKARLRERYGVVPGKKVLLHVGHLKRGRNVDKLLNVGEDYHVFLVVSSVTQNERDAALREQLNARPNTTIIDTYIDHIEEVYQMADVYLFPVQEKENCIDIPLSVLEAAACNIPIVTTDYGELKEFGNEPGFCFISSFEPDVLNEAIDRMAAYRECDNRAAVIAYDWEDSIKRLTL